MSSTWHGDITVRNVSSDYEEISNMKPTDESGVQQQATSPRPAKKRIFLGSIGGRGTPKKAVITRIKNPEAIQEEGWEVRRKSNFFMVLILVFDSYL